MFLETFQRQENEVKECGLKTVKEVRASNFLAGGPRISSYPSALAISVKELGREKRAYILNYR